MEGTGPATSPSEPLEKLGPGAQTFAALLRHYRLATGLSQEALAERAGLHAETVGALERGLSHAPQRETVRLLAEALGLGVEERAALEATIMRRRGARTADLRVAAWGDTTAPFVFVSYSRDDRAVGERLLTDLTMRGIDGLLDRAGLRSTAAGTEQTLRAAIRAVLLVVSPTTRQSRQVKEELAMAEMYGRPVLICWSAGEHWPDCVPPGLRSMPHVDARGPGYPEAVDTLSAMVDRLVGDAPGGSIAGAPQPAEAPRNPYKGLCAFGEQDAGDFFGRDAAVQALLEAVEAAGNQTATARLLAVVGPSGSGKSSLVRAGLMSHLKAGAVSGSANWVYLDPIVPGAHPLEALAVTLAGKLDRSLATLHEDLAADSARGLHLLARRLASRPETRVVLVIDQLEELFTLTAAEEERQQFIDALVVAVTEPGGPMLALLTLRADFYDRPLAYPALGALLETHCKAVLPLAVAELRAAVEQPAALPDVLLAFERNLVGDLLFEVAGRAGALPLLEFTLDQLFARRQGRTLTEAAYQEIGGVRGALSKHAEATYAALPADEHRRLARALFMRLIAPGATEQDTTRRRAALSELTLPGVQQTALIQEVAGVFVAARLLTAGEHAGLIMLEVSHEALIHAWPRLSGWLREAREDIQLQQTITADATAWVRRGRPSDSLYRGTVLAEAQAWAARNTPSVGEQAFVEAAEAAQRQQEAAERERQVRELALAQKAAMADRRAATRLRVLTGVLALFLLAALGLSALAVNNARTAQVNAHNEAVARAAANRAQAAAVTERDAVVIALSHQLAAQAGALLNSQPQLALLLSVEAARLSKTAEVRATLLPILTANTRLIAFLTAQSSPVVGVAFSPDGSTLASGHDDGTIRLWDVVRHHPRSPPLTAETGPVTSVAFSPESKTLASAGNDGAIHVWDVAHRQPLGPPLDGHTGTVWSMAFSPDGTILAASSTTATLQLWDVAHHRPLGPALAGHTGLVWGLAFSANGKILASGSDDSTIRLWDVARRQPLGPALTGGPGAVQCVAFSPDGQTLAAGSYDGTVQLWDVARHRPLGPPLTGHTGIVWSVAFSRDGRTLASSGDDSTVRLWDVVRRQPLGPALSGGSGAVQSVAFSPDGQTLATGSHDGTIRLWYVGSTLALSTVLTGHTDFVNGVAFSPGGKTLASGSVDGTVRLWDVAHHQPLGPPLAGHRDPIWSMAVSPDGSTLAAGSSDGTIQLWDIARRRPIGLPLTVTYSVTSVAFSPDGRTLASCGIDGTIRLWDVGRRRLLGPPLTEAGLAGSVAFNPDGKILASGNSDGSIQLWDVARRQPLGPPITGHINAVDVVAFSPDGLTLASGGFDSTIRLWAVPSMQALGPALTGHTEAVNAVAFSPDSQTLASGSADGTIRLWPIGLQSLVQRACVIANRNLTVQEWRQYLGDLPYHKTCESVL